MKDRTKTGSRPAHPSTTTKPKGEVRHGYGMQAEQESSRRMTLEDILDSENLSQAWKQVRGNRGAAGVDGMEVGDFPDFYAKHWEMIRRKLMDGSYSPSPVRRVLIPKDKGQFRALGIPTVLDRLIQQSIAQVLTPHYETIFSDRSHGFRPRRSAHNAIQEMHEESLTKGKKCHVVDCDLKAFFDTVDHQKLMGKLRESIVDPRVLKLIFKYLKAGAILPTGNLENANEGVPQGGPLSPLLANILLDELDHELEQRGHKFVRYADDFVILCSSPRAGQRIMTSITAYLKKSLKLIVNESKSKVVTLREASFLGFSIVQRKIRWTVKSHKKFKSEVRRLTKRTRGVSPAKIMSDLRKYLRGVINYFAIGIPFGEIRALDQWLRRRLRLYYWKQWGRPRARRRNLLKLGINKDVVHQASRSRKGYWRMSQMRLVRHAMTNDWLEEQGLLSLEKQWCSIRYPDGPKSPKGSK
ncbi:group II intron reverse transcriptase/maturase [Akkermansiaceae bacterium]|nr:group II intron reverse transcriptase/maturase [Akkermansiaceae bacterium]